MSTPKIFTALSSRNYRLYFMGQIVSLLGSWMTQTASMWLVYQLSNSALHLGIVAFCSNAPMFFLAPFTGVLIDRVDKHKLLVFTQVVSMLQSFAFAAFVLMDRIDVPHIIGLALIQGLINAFDMPLRQSLTVDFVEKREHLPSAIALNSSVFNLARLIGPGVAGYVIAWVGTGICFLLDGISYIAVIGALLMMRLPKRQKANDVSKLSSEFKEGFRYVAGYPPIRALIVLVACISAVGYSYAVLTPVFARDVFLGDSKTLGLLMSCTGVGAITAAIYLGSRKTVRGLGKVISLGGMILSGGVLGFSFSKIIPVAMVCLFLAGLGGVLLMASCNTLVQTLVEDDKRGRVMSLYAMAFSGTMPIGNLLMGTLASHIGAGMALRLSALFTLIIVVVFYKRIPKLRAAVKLPVHVQDDSRAT